jgi:hypothetical protein
MVKSEEIVEINNETQMENLKDLWKNEQFICKSKEHLSRFLNDFQQESISSFVESHIRKLKVNCSS